MKLPARSKTALGEVVNGKVSKPQGIIVFGANGSGKTTLGQELARRLNFKHMDIEAYHFEKSSIPYTVERSRETCIRLMLADIEKHKLFVISAVTGDFGETIEQFYTLAAYITAPHDLRMERMKRRSYEQHGTRIQKGGDMYHQHQRFIDFAATRSYVKIDQWAETLACPIIHIDGTVDWRINAAHIAQRFIDMKYSDTPSRSSPLISGRSQNAVRYSVR